MKGAEAVRDLWKELEPGERIPIIETVPETTWIWSDLHLGDRSMLLAWDRPFRNVDEMNRHLLQNWSRRVGTGDTIICLGDVAHPDAWRDRRLVLDLANCPGKRLLVLGNHDTEHHALRNAGFDFDTMCRSAPCATDPPLALSHVPLRTVPPTAVNVHGHLHGAEAPTPRHINVSVEHTDYAPVGLKWILEIALRRVE